MRTFASLPLLLATTASFAAAQDATRTAPSPLITGRASGGCKDQKVVDRCVAAMKSNLAKCSDDNWDCKCSGAANIANCYVDCVDYPEAASARSLSAGTCATANAYDEGLTVVPPVQVTPANNAAELASSTAVPTGSSPGEEQAAGVKETQSAKPSPTDMKESTKPSEGAAPGRVAGGWCVVVGLGLGALV